MGNKIKYLSTKKLAFNKNLKNKLLRKSPVRKTKKWYLIISKKRYNP